MDTLSRRWVLGAGAVAIAAPAMAAPQESVTLSQRYPDPLIKSIDPSFNKYRISNAAVERVATGCRWNEGPVWFGDGRYLLWSDIPNNRIMRWDEAGGDVAVFRPGSNFANGNTRDRQGRLVTCEHLTRRIVRTEYDGRITVLASTFDGKPFNSPNDIVVKSDDSIWFTDPPFGILGNYEGEAATPQLPTNIYRIDGRTGAVTVATGDVGRPNGLAFSPDESRLYVVEGGLTPRVIQVFDVNDDKLTNKRPFYTCPAGEVPDGFRVDFEGNLWCGWGVSEQLDGVRIINAAGAAIGHISLPERCANLTFGGRHRNRLLMTASRSIFSLFVNTQGATLG